ncbi:IS30 family transposase [Lactiplantibacillus argentoratensis]|uniref:IS30 family transposase n=1 Tax=Lactiplantibacillus argentoratensis TaxID=271881 RepID=UPI00070CED76|nr:IS30 family transposase [Lactiplantibacillus argentoratensis]GEO54784.1 IS30 family transposase [Lactiplantibacillus argentoratensis]
MHKQLITSRPKGHHLTAVERGIIATLHAEGVSNRQIALIIGVCHQTIANELARGTVDQVKKINDKLHYYRQYVPEAAQTRYEMNRQRCHRPLKLRQVADFLAYFTRHFKQDGWAPDVAVGRAKRDHLYRSSEMVCTSTIYNYIEDQRLEVRNIDLLERTSRRTKRKANTTHKRLLQGRSIDDRPKRVDNRHEFGHYELDTIVGHRNGQESVIMTFIERKSRHQFMRLIDSRDADSVNYALREIIAEYGDVIKTVTADNGSEFADLESIFDGVATVYYAHPYRSSERGTNEVHNKMVRRYFPKHTSLDTVSPAAVAEAEVRLNRLPRKELDYRTTEEVFTAECLRVRRRTVKVATANQSTQS